MPRRRTSRYAIENDELRQAIKTIERVCDQEFAKLQTQIQELRTENAQLRELA